MLRFMLIAAASALALAQVAAAQPTIVYEDQELVASDAEIADLFDMSVAASGDVIVVGAYGDDDNGSYSGSAYVYRWNGDQWQWVEEQKLCGECAAQLASVIAVGAADVLGAR